MPQRRAPFSYGLSDGQGASPAPTIAMPMTGTGTEPSPYTTDMDTMPGGVESPATVRRRIMPIAGTLRPEPDVLQAVQQMLAQRKAGQ